jgi:hypothetical protein
MGKTFIRFCFVAAVIISLHTSNCNAIEMKGISYCGWWRDALSTPDSNASLANASIDGCKWVSINVWGFQDTIYSTVIEPNYSLYSVSPESIKVAIDRCHQLGMKVMLKPNVDLAHDPDHWRGQIVPSTAWFNGYHNFINFWADFAQQNNVELFSIGCELVNTSSWADSWRSVANDVRTHYSGPIVYSALFNDEKNIYWWDAVDYIGIDAYYALTSLKDPTPAQLATSWTNHANSIETWRNNNWPNKNVIFTEVGYSSYDGANTQPWYWPAIPPVDVNEQADCYESLLSVCRNRPWWKGAFWWNWETDPNAGGLSDLGFTPQNKPAEQVLRDYYITITGDMNDDRKVDLYDIALFADYWLDQSVVGWPDFNNDQKVDFKDFAMLAANWRQAIPFP